MNRFSGIILLSILSLLHATCSPPTESLRTGDLLFCGIPVTEEDDTAAGAIAASVGHGDINYIHVAILEVEGDTVWVIDATMKRGVDRHPLDTLIGDFTSADGEKPVLTVKRLKDGFSKDFIDRAKDHLGEPYDYYFMPGNGMMYCSELVQECYRDRDGGFLFESKPMNFRDSSGGYPAYWTRLFEQLGEPIPQGEPGTNPQDMAGSPILEDVTELPPFS